ncbi:hypothetical protein AeRB84_012766 [Aphanomyces euteiches]|nr:hypothetical protein AeRB84_012766 [Aphanomyces euteiches]
MRLLIHEDRPQLAVPMLSSLVFIYVHKSKALQRNTQQLLIHFLKEGYGLKSSHETIVVHSMIKRNFEVYVFGASLPLMVDDLDNVQRDPMDYSIKCENQVMIQMLSQNSKDHAVEEFRRYVFF